MASTYNGSVANLVDPLTSSPLNSPSHAGQHTEINDALQTLGVWTSYTPTWRGSTTNPVIGNGVINASYIVFNKTAIVKCLISMGTTTTYGSGRYDVTLPSGLPIAGTAYTTIAGSAFFYDGSATAAYVGNVVRGPTNDVVTFRIAGSAFGDVTPTAPFTFANTDQISFIATYEVV